MDIVADKTTQATSLIELSSEIVAAYVGHNALLPSDLPKVISDVYAALAALTAEVPAVAERGEPAVPVRRSVTPDHLVCLEDGKKFKSLKRHLMTYHALTPQQYRARWGLPADYPMVAPNYSVTRSSIAKSSELGRQAAPPAKRGRKTR